MSLVGRYESGITSTIIANRSHNCALLWCETALCNQEFGLQNPPHYCHCSDSHWIQVHRITDSCLWIWHFHSLNQSVITAVKAYFTTCILSHLLDSDGELFICGCHSVERAAKEWTSFFNTREALDKLRSESTVSVCWCQLRLEVATNFNSFPCFVDEVRNSSLDGATSWLEKD